LCMLVSRLWSMPTRESTARRARSALLHDQRAYPTERNVDSGCVRCVAHHRIKTPHLVTIGKPLRVVGTTATELFPRANLADPRCCAANELNNRDHAPDPIGDDLFICVTVLIFNNYRLLWKFS
jgi:hypothetical protein